MKQALKPVRRRLRVRHLVRGLFWGLLLGAAACLLLTILSFLIPIEGLWRYLLMLGAGLPLAGMLLGLLLPVTLPYAAKAADAAGLKERSITALALGKDETPMAALQRADAEAALKALPARQAIPIRIPRWLWIPVLSLALITAGLQFLPNPQNDVLKAMRTERKVLSAQADEVEEAAERMLEEDLTDEERRELRRITADMARELREAQDKREALERLDEQQKEMDRLQQQIQQRRADNLSSALGGQSDLRRLASAMESGSTEEIQEALEELAEMMQDEAKQNELAEQLANAAQSTPTGAAQQSLSQAASSLSAGNLSQALSQLAQAATSTTSGGQSAGSANLDALMRMARSGVASSGQGMGTKSPTGGGSGGQGQGQGQSGISRPGLGSTNRDAGYREGFSQSMQQIREGPSVERYGEYERIYDPTRVGGDNEVTNVDGEVHEGSMQQIELGPGAGGMDGYVPYNQVIGEYRDAAAQSMNRQALPAALQEWVNRYFDALID